MTEIVYAVVGSGGVVENRIVASAEYVADLKKHIQSDDVDTGDYRPDHKFYDVTNLDPGPDVGWIRSKNGRYAPPALTKEELAAQEASRVAAETRAADDTFLEDVAVRLAEGGSLTRDERDRKDVIMARRS